MLPYTQIIRILNKCTIMYEVKGKVLYDNIQFVLDMMNEIIYIRQSSQIIRDLKR